MNSSEYKIYHESFMKNNHGTNAVHVFFCILFTVQSTLLCAIQEKKRLPWQYLHEYAVIVFPLILAHTVLADFIYLLNFIMFIVLLYNVVNLIIYGTSQQPSVNKTVSETRRLHSFTCVRGLTYLITALAILAVDFQLFPRNLAKTEKYGYSLMDTGVGLFVLMSGLVHKEFQKHNLMKIARSNIKFFSILLVLGISRYVSIKQLDYHEHVTEYGVHWNFFFTLAFCKLISSTLLYFSNNPLLLSIITIFMHETLLYRGLEEWVFAGFPRLTIVDANREGISSNLGYVSLYLFAVYVKKLLSIKGVHILNKIIIFAIVSVFLAYLVNFLRPTSRTLANAGYILFLISVLLTIISIFYVFEIYLALQPPLIILAINNNGLIYFLICNLLTGLINIMFQTLFVSGRVTLILLNIYMASTLIATILLNAKEIKI